MEAVAEIEIAPITEIINAYQNGSTCKAIISEHGTRKEVRIYAFSF